MKLKLEPYQEAMRDYLLGHPRSYCCVGLGLGKTAATLSALNDLLVDGAIRSALVVAPLRVAQLTWPNEVEKWDEFNWMEVENLRGKKPSGKAQIYTINYERLKDLKSLDFCDVVVFDEITRAKNPQSKRIKGIRALFRNHQRWGLTGTPRPNSLLELFGQIRLLDDGERLFPTFSRYRDAYFYPTDYMRYNWVPKKGVEGKIYQAISDITIAQLSSEYLEIPDTVVEDIEIALPTRQLYDELEKEFLAIAGKTEIVALNAAVLVGKLLQVCSGAIYSGTREVEVLHPAKLDALAKLLKRLDEPALIACQFIHERERICRTIKGAVDASTFQGDIEKAWNQGKIRYLVADPRSLGHGLNLQQGGRTVIWFSPIYSRELYDQFNARVARKGQTQPPLIYRLICTGTIDDVVVETLRNRGEDQNIMLQIMANYRKIQ
jgi:SNF2 family DNA or RNA helicase